MFQGLRTVVYKVKDMEAAKSWYSKALEIEPYFDEPFYIGFNVAGYELGLQPTEEEKDQQHGCEAYWGVEDIEKTASHLLALGAREREPIQNVGGDILVGTFFDPFGNIFGIIRNPHFKLP